MNQSHVSDRLGDYVEGDLSLAERAQVERHVAECGECETELRELRTTVALLRSLPDAEPPEHLTAEVMRRIQSGETRSSPVVELLRRATEPRVVTALAAGVAAMLAAGTIVFGAGNFLGTPSDTPLGRVAVQSDPAVGTDAHAAGASRPLPSRWAAGSRGLTPVRQVPRMFAGFEPAVPFQGRATAGATAPVGIFGTAVPEVPMRDLDGELDGLFTDPNAFLDRFRRTSEEARERMIAPLVEHSARRGDVTAVARQLGIAAQPTAVPASTR